MPNVVWQLAKQASNVPKPRYLACPFVRPSVRICAFARPASRGPLPARSPADLALRAVAVDSLPSVALALTLTHSAFCRALSVQTPARARPFLHSASAASVYHLCCYAALLSRPVRLRGLP